MYKCKYFGIKELVSKAVYDYFRVYGDNFIWCFFDGEVLKDLDTIRESWGKPLIINNWSGGGSLSQCGLRSNIEPLTKERSAKNKPYLGGHNLGKGFDLHDKGGNNRGLFEHVSNLIKTGKLKKMKRLEDFVSTPTWVHVDALQSVNDGLCIFKP